jgi:hypothetical protein
VLELEGNQSLAGEVGQLESRSFAILCVALTEFNVLVVENCDSAGNIPEQSAIGALTFFIINFLF